jgi:hypothetical protein
MGEYNGNERRVHRVYVTRNTEYHVRKGICVAVRDRNSGRWINGHAAITKKLEGSLKFHGHGGYSPHFGDPGVGDAIYFNDGDRDLITSRLEKIERPERATVALYPRERVA